MGASEEARPQVELMRGLLDKLFHIIHSLYDNINLNIDGVLKVRINDPYL